MLSGKGPKDEDSQTVPGCYQPAQTVRKVEHKNNSTAGVSTLIPPCSYQRRETQRTRRETPRTHILRELVKQANIKCMAKANKKLELRPWIMVSCAFLPWGGGDMQFFI